jgi:hypothetical protein
MKRAIWGLVAIAVYVTTALLIAGTGRVIPRPLYDGLAPAAPYRYVSPPPDLAADNEEPLPGKGRVDFAKGKSQPTSISTGDGQLQLVVPNGAFDAKKKEKAVDITITPLAPPAPLDVGGGLRVDGNAYRIEAAYARSGDAAPVQREVTVVLRYAHNATEVVRRSGASWTRLRSQVSSGSLQLFAATDDIGVFAAAGRPPTTWTRWLPYGAGALGVTAGVVGYLSGRRGWFRRRPKSRTQKRASQRARAKRRGGRGSV